MLCTKLAHFKFDAYYRSQNSWGRGMFTVPFLPDIGLQLPTDYILYNWVVTNKRTLNLEPYEREHKSIWVCVQAYTS